MALLDRSELSVASALGLTDEFLAWQGSNVGNIASLSDLLDDILIFRKLAGSSVPATLTGTVAETTLATIAIPAGAMGANGILRITSIWSNTSNGNTKTLRGGRWSGSTIMLTTNVTTNQSHRMQLTMFNRNSESSQVAQGSGGILYGPSGTAVATSAIDTASAQSMTLTAQLANAGDTVVLESYHADILHRA